MLTFVFSPKRAFVWSLEKDAPIGCLTPSCYLGYIAKHIYDCDIYTTFEDISSLPERPTVSEDTPLQEVSASVRYVTCLR